MNDFLSYMGLILCFIIFTGILSKYYEPNAFSRNKTLKRLEILEKKLESQNIDLEPYRKKSSSYWKIS